MVVKFAIVLTTLLYISTSVHFELDLWKNYDLDHPYLVLSHSRLPHMIQLPAWNNSLLQSTYHYAEDTLLMEFQSPTTTLEVLSLGQAIAIQGLQNNQKIILSQDIQQHQEYYIVPVRDGQKGTIAFFEKIEGTNNVVIAGDFDTLFLGKLDISIESLKARFASTRQQSKQKVYSWLNKLTVPKQYFQFSYQMLSQTIGSICKEQQHIGLCDFAHFGTRHARHEIDTRHSFLVLELLHEEYAKTALFLFEHLINLFEDRLFYEEGHLPFVPIPQHLQMFRIYYGAAKQQGRSARDLSIRVKAVLNGLVNQMLLADVNTLEEEINYRETKNIHPTLYKMLTMKWKATSSKKAVSSIYEESFTPDYFYNYPNEAIDTCISKLAWVAYAASEYSRLITEIGDPLDKVALEQPASLLKVTQYFMNSDGQAQHGRYYSINSVGGGVRVYAKQGGYQSLLPFVYGLTSVFPEQLFKNITTRYGLASLNVDHPRANSHYEYRSNIHSYFNYKILFGAKKNLKKDNLPYSKMIDEMIAGIREFITARWNEKQSFTMWSAEGNGLRNKKQLSALNVGFFRNSVGYMQDGIQYKDGIKYEM